jgi:hypothetical protein
MVQKQVTLWETQAEAVRVTGVSRRTIKEWIDQKNIEQNPDGLVDLVIIFQRDIARKQKLIDRLKLQKEEQETENPNQRLLLAKCRTEEAVAGLKELELQKLRGEVINFSEALEQFQTALLTTRARFLALPSRMALQLAGISEPKTIAAILTQAIDECLQELAVEFANSREITELESEEA